MTFMENGIIQFYLHKTNELFISNYLVDTRKRVCGLPALCLENRIILLKNYIISGQSEKTAW